MGDMVRLSCFSLPELLGMLAAMKVRAVLKLLKADGWYKVPAKGGHRQFKHRPSPAGSLSQGK
jgi:hypothetical protein